VIFEAGTLDFAMAALIAAAPSWGAGTVMKAPLNYRGNLVLACRVETYGVLRTLPVGVRAALSIYAS
jgi:hypothetical protein